MEEVHIAQTEALRNFCIEALIHLRAPDGDAAIIADSMVEADLRGVGTHGVLRLPGYARMLREGNMNPQPSIKVIQESNSTAVLDVDNAVGNLAAARAMELAISKARDASIGVITVRNSTHCGALACYTTMAIEKDMIGFMTSNGPPIVPAYGGKTRCFSTNPWSFGIPAGEELPIVLDMATTVAAGGKIRVASIKGEKIPLDWALDKDGVPTDDPVKVMSGGFYQWIGGPKGYGLAVVTDVLAGILSGGGFGQMLAPLKEPYGSNLIRQGHFVAALNIEAFMPLTEFTGRVDQMIRGLKASERINSMEEIRLPGERGLKMKEERLKSGIPLISQVWDELKNLRKELNISSDF